jgi:membrane protein
VRKLRNFGSWVIAGLGVGVAVRAFVTRRPPEENDLSGKKAPIGDGDADAILLTTPLAQVEPRSASFEQPADRLQTWVVIARLVLQRLKAHTTTVVAGSLAYYALLAVVPSIIAAISIYGLVADPADLTGLIESIADQLPQATTITIRNELQDIVTAPDTGLGLGAVLGILAALWSASAGAKVLITGVNMAYGERETRSYLVVRGLALLLTLGMIVGIVVVVSGVAILPTLVDSSLANIVRWPALIALVVVGLAALYRIAPSDAPGRNHPVWQGALAAAAVWLPATAGFSAVVAAFSFGATYGTLAGVVVLLVWFFLSGLIVLLGAEFNAAIENRRQRLATATR